VRVQKRIVFFTFVQEKIRDVAEFIPSLLGLWELLMYRLAWRQATKYKEGGMSILEYVRTTSDAVVGGLSPRPEGPPIFRPFPASLHPHILQNMLVSRSLETTKISGGKRYSSNFQSP